MAITKRWGVYFPQYFLFSNLILSSIFTSIALPRYLVIVQTHRVIHDNFTTLFSLLNVSTKIKFYKFDSSTAKPEKGLPPVCPGHTVGEKWVKPYIFMDFPPI